MPLTLECGVCHSLYRIDETLITIDGIKITCPKCLTFFFLKRGSNIAETPIMEQLAQDGVYQVQSSSPVTGEETLDDFLSEKTQNELAPFDLMSQEFNTDPESKASANANKTQDLPIPTKSPLFEKEQKVIYHRIRTNELSDYPPDQPIKSKIDYLLIPAALLAIVASGLLFLNYQGIVRIPGLEAFRSMSNGNDSLQTAPQKSNKTLPSSPDSPKPKYGFPKVDESGQLVHSPTPTSSPSPTPHPLKSKKKRF